jgi:hypothetical protein
VPCLLPRVHRERILATGHGSQQPSALGHAEAPINAAHAARALAAQGLRTRVLLECTRCCVHPLLPNAQFQHPNAGLSGIEAQHAEHPLRVPSLSGGQLEDPLLCLFADHHAFTLILGYCNLSGWSGYLPRCNKHDVEQWAGFWKRATFWKIGQSRRTVVVGTLPYCAWLQPTMIGPHLPAVQGLPEHQRGALQGG